MLFQQHASWHEGAERARKGGTLASIEINWAETGPISIFEEARKLGFDLRRSESQPADVQAAIRNSPSTRSFV